MSFQIAFTIFSLIVIAAAWRVVTGRDIVRCALALVMVLGGLAPIFVLLAAEYLAVVQVLVYVGAVIVLFLFGIMLTPTSSLASKSEQTKLGRFRNRRVGSGIIAGALLAGLIASFYKTFGSERLAVTPGSTERLGTTLLYGHIVEFEAISVLLLAVLIGAIVLARRES